MAASSAKFGLRGLADGDETAAGEEAGEEVPLSAAAVNPDDPLMPARAMIELT